MRVLWYANTPCGATEILTGCAVTSGGWLFSLSEQLVKIKGLELHIAFFWGKELNSFEHNGITYHPVYREGEGRKIGRLINRWRRTHGMSVEKKDLPRLLEVVKTVKPDLIHIHGSEESFGMISERQLPCPVVISIQGLLNPILFKFYSGFSRSEISSHEGFMNKLMVSGVRTKEKSISKRALMELDYYSRIPYVIGRTFWDKAVSLAMNPQRQYFIVDEILRSEFYHAKWDKTDFSKPLVLTSTVSYGYYKGVESVYQVAKILRQAGVSFCWNIIGSNEGDTLVNLSEQKVGMRANELNIKLLGRKTAAEMVQLMMEADMFVQVSHIENSPNSLCEAMLLGMPIVASYAGGTASMLDNNVEGRLLQDGEPYSMAGFIMEMASNFDTAKEMGRRAREKALERHDPDRVCNQLLTTYNAILSEGHV